MSTNGPQVQRVAAYALVVRAGQILLTRLAPRVTTEELWTLPGGGVEHGEDPRDAVLREVSEETGLDVTIDERARTFSQHLPHTWRKGRRVDAHSLRIVYDGWVPLDAPLPRVLEVDGSTAEAAWQPIERVLDGSVPTVGLVREALANHRPHRLQRVAAYALVTRDASVLLTRISARGHHAGEWTLPGGGVQHGEHPVDTVAREVAEECGVAASVDGLLTVHDVHFDGTAPSGRHEDFHGIHVVYRASVADDAEPYVAEAGGTTDAVGWVSRDDIERGSVPVLAVVRAALAAR